MPRGEAVQKATDDGQKTAAKKRRCPRSTMHHCRCFLPFSLSSLPHVLVPLHALIVNVLILIMSEKMPPQRKQNQQPKHQIQRKRTRRKKAPPRRQSSLSSDDEEPQQKLEQYTELSAVGHILSDQVHMYALENPLSVGELRQLSAWEDAVQTRIRRHNSCVLENVQLTAEFKKSNKLVSNLRDDLVVLRTSTRRIKEETKLLETKLRESNEESRVLQGASRFLSAIEKLGKACRQEEEEVKS